MPEALKPQPGSAPERYYPQLDGIRAVAVTFVLIGHLAPSPLLASIVGWGDMGVVMFFCLSGFLITGILLRIEWSADHPRLHGIATFYIRRALRIFPIYYLTIAIAIAVGYEPARTYLVRLVTYTLNVPGLPPTDHIGAVSHFWSLSIEEQFYLFWPMLVLFVPRRHIGRLVVGLIVLSWTYKFAMALGGVRYKLVFFNLPGCLDSLGLGAWLAVCRHRLGQAGVKPFVEAGKIAGLFVVALTLVRMMTDIDPYYEGYRWYGVALFAVAAVAFTGWIAFATLDSSGRIGRILGSRPLVAVGRISYGIYVYHFFFPYIGPYYIKFSSPWGHAAVYVVCSLATASISWFLIERPLLGLKRFFPVKSSG